MTGAMLSFLDWFDRRTSGMGLVIGALFVAGSLTPSLIPRSPEIQGILAGFCFPPATASRFWPRPCGTICICRGLRRGRRGGWFPLWVGSRWSS
ncbi:hypothetical protein [Paracoccus liaowanqingii]|uniref:hypothetical protein n=1 Tax=Paracoccus liaowanqingii TaxID=2560053 RepID=UPI001F0EB397|nr:hypothetical protein [Paracoccus liaowanqingii]